MSMLKTYGFLKTYFPSFISFFKVGYVPLKLIYVLMTAKSTD